MAETVKEPSARLGPDDALEENVAIIRAWERATLLKRSRAERLGDWIVAKAASAEALSLHAIWFVGWIVANTGMLPGVAPFDPFPFPFLTMTVSLEAIFLTLFVLASQNRLARESDLRSELDLQVNLLAEREMTAVLRLLQDLTRQLKVRTSVTADQIRDLARTTDVGGLAARMEALSEETATRPESAAERQLRSRTTGKAPRPARRRR